MSSTPAPVEGHTGAGKPSGAPISMGRATPRPPATEPVSAPAQPDRKPRPHPPEEPGDWAAGPGTPLSTWALRPEEAQPFDPAALPKTMTVRAGDTLYSISARTQVPMRALVEANDLRAPFALVEGQALRLPPPRLHRVAAGETLLAVAARYNVDARSLALLNRMAKPYAVRTGDQLVLPALARPRLDEPLAPAPTPAAPGSAPAIKLAWPLQGSLLTKFGPQSGGRRSDGVDIAAPEGTPIKAAAAGNVIYAGADLEAYGNLMLVQHADGWITAYGMLESLDKKVGDRLSAGQVLGEVGPGIGGAPRLHFQLRRGARATDPLPALPKV